MPNFTKIICTIGPATDNVETLNALINAGLNEVRINCSHGTNAEHQLTIDHVRAVAEACKKNIPIMLDLGGPKIRIGNLYQPIEIVTGSVVYLTNEIDSKHPQYIATNFPRLISDLAIGDRILIDDGYIELKVLSKNATTAECFIVDGGTLKPHKGVNLPNTKLNIPAITAKDMEDLRFGLNAGISRFALSFVRKADDVKNLRQVIKEITSAHHHVSIISKIEKPEAVDNLEEIISASDEIIVARGDLGVEMALEDVTLIQKTIIRLCNKNKCPVIVATQLLESMINNPRPTRAEVSDITNAVLDGADALLLTGETSIGQYPVECVKMMRRIIQHTKQYQAL